MPPTPEIIIDDAGCPMVAAQLTGPGPGRAAGDRHYAVAMAINDGHHSPLEIAYYLRTTVAQVWISLRWLQKQGWLLMIYDQISGLTLSGKRALQARTMKKS